MTAPTSHRPDDLVLDHLDLAQSLAARYRNRGESFDDLVQVAYLGLVKAAHRYRPDAGSSFAAYAAPTITGEIRRHFRDHGWDVRPPRRLQELRARLRTVQADLEQRGGCTDEALAAELGATVAEVREARQASNAYSAVSLDARYGGDGDDTTLADTLVAEGDGAAAVDDLVALADATSDLGGRERRILALRFYADATQSQIAADLGISQMQVSRLLSALLRRLRERLTDQVPVRAVGSSERGRMAGESVPTWSRIPSNSSASTSWAA
ncbi:sigma-70 family RNA polymerase sigma factor [Kineococcus sp. T13]|uniref:sigma-70 family RNA polymerase sigma factor n=1 Tax=Kineococcus vitellinus TaxID=2696565 RepID=UPI001412865B|nr:sigma-70 family RNA polymerase sigma factor [Kineococcus vitellinus]NAZ77738.1 sigma-70 family RNA polymerase sigma factor [Kineococcus vitellinus]